MNYFIMGKVTSFHSNYTTILFNIQNYCNYNWYIIYYINSAFDKI